MNYHTLKTFIQRSSITSLALPSAPLTLSNTFKRVYMKLTAIPYLLLDSLVY